MTSIHLKTHHNNSRDCDNQLDLKISTVDAPEEPNKSPRKKQMCHRENTYGK